MFKNHISLVFLLISSILLSLSVSTINEGSFTDGLALDSQGNLYCSGYGFNTVYKYGTNGRVSVFKDNIVTPNGIGINAVDEIYICSHQANKILKYNISGNLMETYSNFMTPSGILNIPNTTDMLVVEYGNEYTDATTITNSKIKKLAADGTITTLHSGLPLNGPAGITFINDIPYIANFNDRKIFKFENGKLSEIAQLPSEGPANRNFLGFLSSIDGQLIATHIGGHKVYKIDPNSGVTSIYIGSTLGSVDGNINIATLDSPNGIIADKTNKIIYISQGSQSISGKNLRIIN